MEKNLWNTNTSISPDIAITHGLTSFGQSLEHKQQWLHTFGQVAQGRVFGISLNGCSYSWWVSIPIPIFHLWILCETNFGKPRKRFTMGNILRLNDSVNCHYFGRIIIQSSATICGLLFKKKRGFNGYHDDWLPSIQSFFSPNISYYVGDIEDMMFFLVFWRLCWSPGHSIFSWGVGLL